MLKFVATLIFAAIIAQPAAASEFTDEHGQWEVRVSFASTLDPLGTEDLGRGFGLEGTAAIEFVPRIGAYVGWSWHRFSNDEYYRYRAISDGVDSEDYGLVFGLQWKDRVWGWPGSAYRVRAGVTHSRLRFEGIDGAITEGESARGWEVSGAIITDIGGDWRLTQELRFRSQRRAVALANNGGQAKLRYFSFNFGLGRSF